uniref:Uncharacterized protein n=1 Tax=Oryza rufipogon TaxID=4529 RepID=A5YJ81_ORYRU|nr:unknown [Oryza rufipogon]
MIIFIEGLRYKTMWNCLRRINIYAWRRGMCSRVLISMPLMDICSIGSHIDVPKKIPIIVI